VRPEATRTPGLEDRLGQRPAHPGHPLDRGATGRGVVARDRVAEEQTELVRVVDRPPAVRQRDGSQPLGCVTTGRDDQRWLGGRATRDRSGVGGSAQGDLEMVAEVLVPLGDQEGEQLLPRAHVPVQPGGAHRHPAGDRPERDRDRTVFADLGQRRLLQVAERLLPLAVAA
jgi:hypothetical protein